MDNNENVVRGSALSYVAGTTLPRGLFFNEDVDLEADTDPGQNGTGDQDKNTRLAALERNQALMQIISDPDVAAVVALKRAGKQVAVGEKVAPVEETEEDDEPNLLAEIKDDDPHKELLTKIDALINAKLGPVSERVKKQLGELTQQNKQFENVANEMQRKEVDTQIEKAKEKFPEFDKQRPRMLELSKKHPTLNVEQLALLAMNDAGTLKLQRSSVQSEKPTNQPRRPISGSQQPKTRMGRKGFNEILTEKLGGLTLDTEE